LGIPLLVSGVEAPTPKTPKAAKEPKEPKEIAA
jgi:hypothetical protein